ncbi:MAG: TetR/AcrR family transcriptional regulator [Pseudomonadota bacterium]
MSSTNLATRDRILKATQDLMEQGRVAEVRMSDIAKHAKISRQALYLHFPNRAELLVATTRYLDDVQGIDARVEAQVMGASGIARLDAFIEIWFGHIPHIQGVAKALMQMQGSDKEADAAWQNRMTAVRRLCKSCVESLREEGRLADGYTSKQAVDVLFMLVSVPNWLLMVQSCGWSQKTYLTQTRATAHRMLLKDEAL